MFPYYFRQKFIRGRERIVIKVKPLPPDQLVIANCSFIPLAPLYFPTGKNLLRFHFPAPASDRSSQSYRKHTFFSLLESVRIGPTNSKCPEK